MNIFVGCVSSILVAAFLAFLEVSFDLNIYGFMLLYVFPIGAMVASVVGGMGYYWSSRSFGIQTKQIDKLWMIGISLACYVLIQILEYANFTVDGVPVSQNYGLWEYFDVVVQNTQLTLYSGFRKVFSTEGLGLWGYLLVAIQIAGYVGGGIVSVELLKMVPYCRNCRKYTGKENEIHRSFSSRDEAKAFWDGIETQLQAGQKEQVLGQFQEGREEEIIPGRPFRTSVEARRCPGCRKSVFRSTIETVMNGRWERINGTAAEFSELST
jgi:hypothetical protein